MHIEEKEKTLSIWIDEKLVITKVKNPITGEYSFLIVNEVRGEVIMTNDLMIDGIKIT